MDLESLIEHLRNVQRVHPEATVVEARTTKGRLTSTISVYPKGTILIIEGARGEHEKRKKD